MGKVTRAELHRRAREWLHIEFHDAAQTAAFEAAKRALTPTSPDHLHALIAVGEFPWVRALLSTIEEPDAFLRALGAYFSASADDGLVRAVWDRVVAMVRANETGTAKETLESLAIAAEAIGDRTLAGELNGRAKAAQPAVQQPDEILELVYGTLGYAPDAPKGRLLLRPEIDPGWNRLTVRNLHIGDALIDFDYVRTEGRMEFSFVQSAGAYPIRLIFEPILSVAVTSAYVDGTPASLDFRPHRDRILIPVQIMLDDRRVVGLE